MRTKKPLAYWAENTEQIPIDLHMHSIASDGVYTPTEVVEIMHLKGRSIIALADHDTMNGVEEATAAAKRFGMHVIPALEMSTQYTAPNADDLHILGYYVDPTSMDTFFSEFKAMRETRNRGIVDKLQALGYAITYDEVAARGTGTLGKGHIAQVLVQKGSAQSVRKVMKEILHREGDAYVPKQSINSLDAIDCIHNAGGIAVLAHPGRYGIEDTVVRELAAHGLDGLEAYHIGHSAEQCEHYHALATELGLPITVGTDFHGYVRQKLAASPQESDISWILKR